MKYMLIFLTFKSLWMYINLKLSDIYQRSDDVIQDKFYRAMHIMHVIGWIQKLCHNSDASSESSDSYFLRLIPTSMQYKP